MQTRHSTEKPTQRRRSRVPLVYLALGVSLTGSVVRAADTASDALVAATGIQDFSFQSLGHALLCMVVAAILGAVLAFRPRRGGGPPREAGVTQAQIMMAIVGSLVMLIVGASLARAFAIAGSAGLVRYRTNIRDPKDASVLLSCLAIGLASGVGLLYLAAAGTLFIMGILWALEWQEPWPAKTFELTISAKTPGTLQSAVEKLLKASQFTFELRETTESHITYLVQVPQGKRTDGISEKIAALQGTKVVEVEWDEKKAPK